MKRLRKDEQDEYHRRKTRKSIDRIGEDLIRTNDIIDSLAQNVSQSLRSDLALAAMSVMDKDSDEYKQLARNLCSTALNSGAGISSEQTN